MTKGVSIGRASVLTGVKVPTIRYYEQIGLLPAPPRTAGNRRLYERAEIERLSFVRHARALGFDIGAIRELLAMAAEPQASCHEVDSIASSHIAAIEQRIARLQALGDELRRMIGECGRGRICDCRIIEAISG